MKIVVLGWILRSLKGPRMEHYLNGRRLELAVGRRPTSYGIPVDTSRDLLVRGPSRLIARRHVFLGFDVFAFKRVKSL